MINNNNSDPPIRCNRKNNKSYYTKKECKNNEQMKFPNISEIKNISNENLDTTLINTKLLIEKFGYNENNETLYDKSFMKSDVIINKNSIIKEKMLNILKKLETDKELIKLIYTLITKSLENIGIVKVSNSFLTYNKHSKYIRFIENYINKSKNNKEHYENYNNLFQIIKAVFRLKFNNSVNENNKIELYNSLKKENSIMALAYARKISIPTAENNMEGYHNFTNIEYFIYKSENFNFKNKNDIDIRNELLSRAPFYYQNGLIILNPRIKTYWTKTKNQIMKNINSNLNSTKLNSMKLKINQDGMNILNNKEKTSEIIDRLFNEVDNINKLKKLAKIFTGLIDDPSNKNFNPQNIDINIFQQLCESLDYKIDTINIFDNNKSLIIQKLNKNSINKKKINNTIYNVQHGGVVDVAVYAATLLVIGVSGALYDCSGLLRSFIGIIGFPFCFAIFSVYYTIVFTLSFIAMFFGAEFKIEELFVVSQTISPLSLENFTYTKNKIKLNNMESYTSTSPLVPADYSRSNLSVNLISNSNKLISNKLIRNKLIANKLISNKLPANKLKKNETKEERHQRHIREREIYEQKKKGKLTKTNEERRQIHIREKKNYDEKKKKKLIETNEERRQRHVREREEKSKKSKK